MKNNIDKDDLKNQKKQCTTKPKSHICCVPYKNVI